MLFGGAENTARQDGDRKRRTRSIGRVKKSEEMVTKKPRVRQVVPVTNVTRRGRDASPKITKTNHLSDDILKTTTLGLKKEVKWTMPLEEELYIDENAPAVESSSTAREPTSLPKRRLCTILKKQSLRVNRGETIENAVFLMSNRNMRRKNYLRVSKTYLNLVKGYAKSILFRSANIPSLPIVLVSDSRPPECSALARYLVFVDRVGSTLMALVRKACQRLRDFQYWMDARDLVEKLEETDEELIGAIDCGEKALEAYEESRTRTTGNNDSTAMLDISNFAVFETTKRAFDAPTTHSDADVDIECVFVGDLREGAKTSAADVSVGDEKHKEEEVVDVSIDNVMESDCEVVTRARKDEAQKESTVSASLGVLVESNKTTAAVVRNLVDAVETQGTNSKNVECPEKKDESSLELTTTKGVADNDGKITTTAISL